MYWKTLLWVIPNKKKIFLTFFFFFFKRPSRGLIFHIFSNQQKILTLERPFAFLLPEMYVYDETVQPKRYIGMIQKQCSPFTREFKIFNEIGKEISEISGNM